MPVVLSCESLTKSFTSRPLFENLSFAIDAGDHIGLIGPNGSGKTTLLKILAGIEQPDSGYARGAQRRARAHRRLERRWSPDSIIDVDC